MVIAPRLNLLSIQNFVILSEAQAQSKDLHFFEHARVPPSSPRSS